jgi:drug/metabolite transporter (DMT)-like permease
LALPLMPMGDATALFLTNQIWTVLMARLFFFEPLRVSHALGLALAIPGALLVVQPPAIFTPPPSLTPAAQPPAFAALLPLTSALGAAGAYIAVQACSKAGVPRSAIVHCFTAGSAALGGVVLLLNGEWRALRTAEPELLGLLALCGFFGFSAQTALTAAISLDSAATVAISMLSEVPPTEFSKKALLAAHHTHCPPLAASMVVPSSCPNTIFIFGR